MSDYLVAVNLSSGVGYSGTPIYMNCTTEVMKQLPNVKSSLMFMIIAAILLDGFNYFIHREEPMMANVWTLCSIIFKAAILSVVVTFPG